jgi:hypothetical protein
MRFVYVGGFARDWDTESLIADALVRAGHVVHRVDMLSTGYSDVRRTVRRLLNEAPGVFLFGKCRFRSERSDGNLIDVSVRLINDARAFDAPVACWVFDLMAPEFDRGRFAWTHEVAAACDVFFMTDGYTARRVPNAVVLRQGFPGPTNELRRGMARRQFRCNVAFIGSAYGPRKRWLSDLHAACGQVKNYESVRGDLLFDVCRSARIVIGPFWPTFSSYWSNRIYVVTGYGGCFATPTIEGMAAEGWEPFVNYLPCASLADLQAHRELPDVELRRIADAGQAHTFANFTYDARVKTLCEHLARLRCPTTTTTV